MSDKMNAKELLDDIDYKSTDNAGYDSDYDDSDYDDLDSNDFDNTDYDATDFDRKDLTNYDDLDEDDETRRERRAGEFAAYANALTPGARRRKKVKKVAPSQIETEEERKKAVIRELLSWVEVFAAAIIIALFLTKVVLINAVVPSSSMESLISPGDRLFGFRLQYKFFGDPKRGDVVIFKYPVDESENFIKRVIGLPGEIVTIENGKIYIDDNETPLDEPYLPEEWIVGNDGFVFEVPEDCYFMMGDNRNVSNDARYWAEEAMRYGIATDSETARSYSYVHKSKILGKALLKYWPLSDITKLTN